MIRILLLLAKIQINLGFLTASGNELDARMLEIEAGSPSRDISYVELQFTLHKTGKPQDFYPSNIERINKISHEKHGLLKVFYLNDDVVGRAFVHIPAKTNFRKIAKVRSIERLDLILGKTKRRSKFADWGFFSNDGNGNYTFEIYNVTFDPVSLEITGIRYGHASWPDNKPEK